MTTHNYRDYRIDGQLIKYQVEPGKGIVGCEMHELNGWGTSFHLSKKNFRDKIYLLDNYKEQIYE